MLNKRLAASAFMVQTPSSAASVALRSRKTRLIRAGGFALSGSAASAACLDASPRRPCGRRTESGSLRCSSCMAARAISLALLFSAVALLLPSQFLNSLFFSSMPRAVSSHLQRAALISGSPATSTNNPISEAYGAASTTLFIFLSAFSGGSFSGGGAVCSFSWIRLSTIAASRSSRASLARPAGFLRFSAPMSLSLHQRVSGKTMRNSSSQ